MGMIIERLPNTVKYLEKSFDRDYWSGKSNEGATRETHAANAIFNAAAIMLSNDLELNLDIEG